jgi:hypothetical protein
MANPKAGSPFELVPQTTPKVRVEAGRVVVTLELMSLRDWADIHDIEVTLSGQYAAILGHELILNAQKLG